MTNRFQFCFNFAFNFNLRRFTKAEAADAVSLLEVQTAKRVAQERVTGGLVIEAAVFGNFPKRGSGGGKFPKEAGEPIVLGWDRGDVGGGGGRGGGGEGESGGGGGGSGGGGGGGSGGGCGGGGEGTAEQEDPAPPQVTHTSPRWVATGHGVYTRGDGDAAMPTVTPPATEEPPAAGTANGGSEGSSGAGGDEEGGSGAAAAPAGPAEPPSLSPWIDVTIATQFMVGRCTVSR